MLVQALNFHIMRTFKFFCFLLFSFSCQVGFAQKHDYYWPFGYASYSPLPDIGGCTIDFNSTPPAVFAEDRDMSFDLTIASICDTSGNLLLYTNGIYIANAMNEKIPGSDTLNPGPLSNNNYQFGYLLTQGAIFLPSPNETESNILYLFHETGEYSTPNLSFHSSGLYYTIVDITMNNGVGGVIEKRVPAIESNLLIGKFSAVKHANGRDWWLMLPKRASNTYYRVLLDTAGVQVAGVQEIGWPVHPWDGVGQATFSPNGSKFARFNAISLEHGADLDIYDFDRCAGTLSNPLHLTIVDSCYGGGVAFSPNSRYLYVSSTFYLYQFDMEAEDVLASKDTVAVFDGYEDPLWTVFFLAQLAPDGKIYINSRTAGRTLHIIHNPDEKGDACNVEQHAIQLPTYNAWTMPNFPNYRLGAIPPITPSFTYNILSDSVSFQNTSTGGMTCLWDFGDSSSGEGNQVSHVYAQQGMYVVTQTVSEGCLSETTMGTVEVIFTDVEEKGAPEVKIYPNPAKDEISLEFPTHHLAGTLKLYDIFGRQLLQKSQSAESRRQTLQVHQFETGVYAVRLSFGNGKVFTKKILISR